jgi:hypothetical protein
MMLNFRMLPAVAVAQQSLMINGRRISGTPGSAVDIVDIDARLLSSNGWVACAPSGATSQRPTLSPSSAPYVLGLGFEYFDVTLSKIIFWDGQNWRDPATGSAV